MSKIQISQKQISENKRLIEEWMKRNNDGKIIIASNEMAGVISQSKIQNERRSLPTISCIAKKAGGSESTTKSNLSPKKLVNTKRHLTQPNVVKKIARWSSPAISINIEPAKKTVASKYEEKKSCSDSKAVIVVKHVPQREQASKCFKSKLMVQSNLEKICAPMEKGTKNGTNRTVNKKIIKNLQLKDTQDVYSSMQDNYKYLLTPKHWSVTEFGNDECKQCIVFSKPYVVNENEKLVTVMQKSLIIDKGGTIHYTVHGLPVDIKGTILPNVLDNIKKLLSIVHIFDKMQVCKGLGDDLLIVKTDNLVKDICQVWRHTNCKLLLVKADQCQICLDIRNILLEKEMLFKSEVLSTEAMNITIKEERI